MHKIKPHPPPVSLLLDTILIPQGTKDGSLGVILDSHLSFPSPQQYPGPINATPTSLCLPLPMARLSASPKSYHEGLLTGHPASNLILPLHAGPSVDLSKTDRMVTHPRTSCHHCRPPHTLQEIPPTTEQSKHTPA